MFLIMQVVSVVLGLVILIMFALRLEDIHNQLTVVVRVLAALASSLLRWPSSIAITQTFGGITMAITGITKGGTGSFAATPTPAGSAFPTGTTFNWTADDTSVTLVPSADGTSVQATTVAGDPASAFNLTVTSSFTPPGAAAPLSATVSVPLLAPTPTGIDINQTA